MNETMASDMVTVAGWNIKSGGYSSYDPNLAAPKRELAIRDEIRYLHRAKSVEAFSVIDAHRWYKRYQSEAGIAEHLGYRAARYINLDDARLNSNNGEEIGIAFATDRVIQETRELDLGTRQGLGVVLDVGKYGLQVASVYLDDLSRDIRICQSQKLVSELTSGHHDLPTVIIADANEPRQNMSGASLRTRAADLAFRNLVALLPGKNHFAIVDSLVDMNQRQVIPLFKAAGYHDADPQRRPTAPAVLPVLGLDYVLHNDQVPVRDFEVLPIYGASDHRPIVCTVSTAT